MDLRAFLVDQPSDKREVTILGDGHERCPTGLVLAIDFLGVFLHVLPELRRRHNHESRDWFVEHHSFFFERSKEKAVREKGEGGGDC